ncbi:MAG: ABC transporter permease [Bacteroidetes bacterium]|nr:ABC transporter permease [Bacteroidota bacterium]
MIWHIAKKDFLLNLISARFIVGTVLCLLIIPFTILINLDDYGTRLDEYHIKTVEAKNQLEQTRVYSGLRPVIIRPPNPLSLFSNGIDGNVGTRVKVDFGNIPALPEGKASQRDNPFLNSFMSIDFIGIISILISLLALIFSYDVFTREREDGTMKLSLSKGISRPAFMSGKILGIILTLMPILLLCYLLSIIIILVSGHTSFAPDQWVNLVFLFVFSILYMLVFILAGAFISSMVKQSSTSIIISLLCWIWFVFLTPALAKNFAESLITIEKQDNINYSLIEINREFWDNLHNEVSPRIEKELGMYDRDRSYWHASGGQDGFFETSGTARDVMEYERRMKAETEPIRIDDADKKWIIVKNRLDDLYRQKRLQKNLLMLSPTGMFEMIASSLCQNDENALDEFMEDVREYRETLIRHFETNEWFSDLRYITAQPEDEIASTNEEKNRIAATGQVPDSWSNQNNPVLDLEGVPMFSHASTRLLPVLLHQSLLFIILLLVICSVLTILIAWSFNKYDVR